MNPEPLPWTQLGMTPGEAAHAARGLARAERSGPARLEAAVAGAAAELQRVGLAADAAAEGALTLLAAGLCARGFDHQQVLARLERRASPGGLASSAALRGSALARALWPDAGPERLASARRHAKVLVFLAFAVWGALGVALVANAGL